MYGPSWQIAREIKSINWMCLKLKLLQQWPQEWERVSAIAGPASGGLPSLSFLFSFNYFSHYFGDNSQKALESRIPHEDTKVIYNAQALLYHSYREDWNGETKMLFGHNHRRRAWGEDFGWALQRRRPQNCWEFQGSLHRRERHWCSHWGTPPFQGTVLLSFHSHLISYASISCYFTFWVAEIFI